MGAPVPEGKVFFDLDITPRVWHVVSRTGVAWLMAKNPNYGQLALAAARAMAADGRKVSGADHLAALKSVAAICRLAAG
jgi:hypothetical protein